MSVISRLTSLNSRFSSLLSRCSIRQEVVRKLRTKQKRTLPEEPAENLTKLSKYFIYTAVVVPVGFTGCMIWQYENIRSLARKPRVYEDYKKKEFGIRDHLNGFWNSVPPGKKFIIGLIAVNVAVFCMWRVPNLQPLMMRYFMCMPTKAHSVAASTLSAFSHYSGFHIFCNMYVLWSFSSPVLALLGKEQTLGVYLGAATVSSVCSCMFKARTGRMVASLGASGAVLAFIAIVCYAYPDARLSIAFVDKIIPHSFSAQSALIGIVLLDVVGLALGWKLLDHAAHLGGVLFGLVYAKYGSKLVWKDLRQPVLKRWHNIRDGKSKV